MGYPKDQFIHPVDQNLLCSICNLVLQEAYQCPQCETPFCSKCIRRRLATDDVCPGKGCPVRLSPDTIHQSRLLRNILGKLLIQCQFQPEGCDVVVQLSEYDAHVAECRFNPSAKPTKCENCGMLLPRNRRDKHDCLKDLRKDMDDVQERLSKMETSLTDIRNSIHSVTNIIQDNNDELNKIKRSTQHWSVQQNQSEVARKMGALINEIKHQGIRMSARVESAFLSVDRGNFAPKDAYTDVKIATKSGGVLPSVTRCVKWVNAIDPVLEEGSRILVMDAAPGYMVAILGVLVGSPGLVVSQDQTAEEVYEVKACLQRDKPDLLARKQIIAVQRSWEKPFSEYAPYQAILNSYLQRPGFAWARYLPLMNTGGIMIHWHPEKKTWTAFTKVSDEIAQDLNTEL